MHQKEIRQVTNLIERYGTSFWSKITNHVPITQNGRAFESIVSAINNGGYDLKLIKKEVITNGKGNSRRSCSMEKRAK